MEKSKSIESKTYSIQVPESWTKIEFDKNKYELAFAIENKENSIFFNIKNATKITTKIHLKVNLALEECV